MMPPDFFKLGRYLLATIGLLVWSCCIRADQVTHEDCRPLQPASKKLAEPLEYSDAVLWKVSRDGQEDSYIFGTIHVSDARITTLPQSVSDALNNAGVYVMEALPEPEESLKFSQMMFFDDGTTLRNYLDDTLFDRTAAILQDYQLSSESVVYMKPWAAFLIMNYPAEAGAPLDLQLLDIAKRNNAEVHGLETLSEQGDVFGDMALDAQVQLLLDTLCNYDDINKDFETMKSLYLERDLQGLFEYSNKYSFSEEKVYQDLIKRLLTDRNHRMVDRMQSYLVKGDAFIAVGAMHLPGKEGVLSLLAGQGYEITSLY